MLQFEFVAAVRAYHTAAILPNTAHDVASQEPISAKHCRCDAADLQNTGAALLESGCLGWSGVCQLGGSRLGMAGHGWGWCCETLSHDSHRPPFPATHFQQLMRTFAGPAMPRAIKCPQSPGQSSLSGCNPMVAGHDHLLQQSCAAVREAYGLASSITRSQAIVSEHQLPHPPLPCSDKSHSMCHVGHVEHPMASRCRRLCAPSAAPTGVAKDLRRLPLSLVSLTTRVCRTGCTVLAACTLAGRNRTC